MSRLAILEATSLVGKEIKEALERRRELWRDVRLLTLDTDEYGLLSDVAGEAALLQELNDDSLSGVDLIFVCSEQGGETPALLARLERVPTTVLISPQTSPPGLPTVVAGVNLAALDRDRRPLQVVSPAPAAVALAHLLHPLAGLGLAEATAWLVQPASVHGQAGVDELLDQTRALLSFQSDYPREVFGAQLALNLLPAPGGDGLRRSVLEALPTDVRLSVQVLQGAVFHSITVSALVRLSSDTTRAAVENALEESPYVRVAEDPGALGPVDASGHERLVTGAVSPAPDEPGTYWLWGVMDNLTLGGTGNALAIAETVLQARH